MTCIICTASIDYVLINMLEHILADLSFMPLCYFLCYSIVFLFILPFVHSFISCVFFVDFFSCENKSSSQEKKNCAWLARMFF